jgi:hypothetical protein
VTPTTAAQAEPQQLGYELDGVIADCEQGSGFDAVCLETVKRVRDALAARSAPAAQDERERFEAGLTAYAAFMQKRGNLRHPDEPYNGTANGDSEEAWLGRVEIAARKAAWQAALSAGRDADPAAVYIKVIRPEGYEDVHPDLLLEDLNIHPDFEPQIASAGRDAPEWRDAERYRWLRERTVAAGLGRFIQAYRKQFLDDAIDAAMLAAPKAKP